MTKDKKMEQAKRRKDRLFSLTQRHDLKVLVKRLENKVTSEIQRRENFEKKWLGIKYFFKVMSAMQIKHTNAKMQYR